MSTAAVFSICEEPEREPDHVSGLGGSKYWFEGSGVIRKSDHWGYGIGSCNWWLRELDMAHHESIGQLGLMEEFGAPDVCAYCAFDGFRDRDEFRAEFEAGKREAAFRVNGFFSEVTEGE